jgi:predicted permease
METLLKDVRYALRMVRKDPGFTVIAVLTLGLGIGANSTVFSWMNATLLNPLPGVLDSSEFVSITRGRAGSHSYPDLVDLRDRSRTLAGLTCFALGSVSLTGNGKPEQVWATLATANYFDLLGVKPVRGRGFLPAEDRLRIGAPVAVISYRLWQNRFGGDPSAVGQTIHINTHSYTIVGIAPRIFQGSYTGLRTDIWVPLMMAPQLVAGGDWLTSRGTTWLQALGRLRPGVSREQAQAELTTLFQEIARQYPDSHRGTNQLTVYPLWRAPNGANAFFSQLLPILLGLAGVVLLLTCSNLANLVLVRSVSRRKELAIRLSLGASRRRLVRQLLIESLVLSLAGGVLALLATVWTSNSLMGLAPVSNLPVWVSVSVDRRVLLATLVVAVVTAMLFGALPALRASGTNPIGILKDESGSVAGGGRKARLSAGLAVAQIALSFLMLVSAGLFIRSFRAAHQFNPGFDSHSVLLGSYDLFGNGYKEADGIAFDRQVLEKVATLPGVRNASLADWVPLGFGSSSQAFVPEGYVAGPHEAVDAGIAHVSPGYFATMGIPILRGRDFASQDSAESQLVVVINEALAQRYWPGRDALGKRMKIEGKWATVVAVARTTNYYDLNEPPQPFIYLPLYQFYSSEATIHVRTAGNPLRSAAAVEQAIHQLNADLPFFNAATLDERIQAGSFILQMASVFVGVFGTLALALAAVGIYGVVAYGTEQRTHEIGIRMALGAQPVSVMRMVVGRGMRLALIGLALGVVASLGSTRLMSRLLFGVRAGDPRTFAGVAILLALVALMACYLPARRAMRLDPLVALRHE